MQLKKSSGTKVAFRPMHVQAKSDIYSKTWKVGTPKYTVCSSTKIKSLAPLLYIFTFAGLKSLLAYSTFDVEHIVAHTK